MEVKVKKFYPYLLKMKNSTILGYADVVLDNLIEIRGIKLLQKENGAIFIVPPSVQTKEGTFADVVKFLDRNLREKIRKAVSEYYKNLFAS